jgi:hypothetical protein
MEVAGFGAVASREMRPGQKGDLPGRARGILVLDKKLFVVMKYSRAYDQGILSVFRLSVFKPAILVRE